MANFYLQSETISIRTNQTTATMKQSMRSRHFMIDINRLDDAEMNSETQVQNTKSNQDRGVNDFRFGKLIGEGGYSNVYLAKDIHTNSLYAIKVCEKKRIVGKAHSEYIKRERDIMQRLNNVPGIVRLFYTFQDIDNHFFVMTYAENGDMWSYIDKVGSFDKKCTQFYAAELILSLEQMHKKGVMHRDLKPENILMDKNMHTLIADFNMAAIMTEDSDIDKCLKNHRKRRLSLVGTANYISPEMLNRQCSSKSVDLWAFGCIIYHMLFGRPPFDAATKHLTFEKILNLYLTFPEEFDETARDLIEKLLKIDPAQRLGMADETHCYHSIRKHPFFDGIEWDGLREQIPPTIGDRQHTSSLEFEIETPIPIQTKDECGTQLIDQKIENSQQFDGEDIIKKGLVKRRRWWIFAEMRMLILTTGPHLIYVDPISMVKTEIPWSSELKTKTENCKKFLVLTPNRTYCFEDPQGFAFEWCNTIENLRQQINSDKKYN